MFQPTAPTRSGANIVSVRRTTLLLGLGSIFLGSLLLVRWQSSGPTEPARAVVARPHPRATSDAASEAPSAPEARPVAQATVDAPRLTPETTPPPPEPQGLEDGGSAGHPVGDFSWKYGHASADERRDALRSVQRDYERELARSFERRVRSGQFQEAACAGLDVAALLPELEAGGRLHAVVTVPGNRPVRSADDAEGATGLRWASFERFDEDTLYERADELDWLRRAGP